MLIKALEEKLGTVIHLEKPSLSSERFDEGSAEIEKSRLQVQVRQRKLHYFLRDT